MKRTGMPPSPHAFTLVKPLPTPRFVFQTTFFPPFRSNTMNGSYEYVISQFHMRKNSGLRSTAVRKTSFVLSLPQACQLPPTSS